MVSTNRLSYLESIASELSVQSKRVRDLIGDAHWLSDGQHKEFLLLSVLHRYLPAGIVASRGFVVGQSSSNQISKEQDVLIVDTSIEAPLFHQGNLIITFPAQVRAVISVKTTVSDTMVSDAIEGLASIFNAHFSGNTDPPWCGVYFFEDCPCQPATLGKYLRNALSSVREKSGVPKEWMPDGFACGNDLCCIKRNHMGKSAIPTSVLKAYRLRALSTAAFLGQLLDHLSVSRGGSSTILESMSAINIQPLEGFRVP